MGRNAEALITIDERKVNPRSALGRLIKELKDTKNVSRRRAKCNSAEKLYGETAYSEYVERGYGETPYRDF